MSTYNPFKKASDSTTYVPEYDRVAEREERDDEYTREVCPHCGSPNWRSLGGIYLCREKACGEEFKHAIYAHEYEREEE